MTYRPENLVYIAKQYIEIPIYPSGTGPSYLKKPLRKVKVRPTFIADAAKEKAIQRGMEWARQSVWDGTKYVSGEETVFNRPYSKIVEVELLDISGRTEGGRAWKVLIEGTFYVDLREDQLLSVLRDGKDARRGCSSDHLFGRFMEVKFGSRMSFENERTDNRRARCRAVS